MTDKEEDDKKEERITGNGRKRIKKAFLKKNAEKDLFLITPEKKLPKMKRVLLVYM